MNVSLLTEIAIVTNGFLYQANKQTFDTQFNTLIDHIFSHFVGKV